MKRRTAMLLSAALIAASAAMLSPVPPASADTDVCAGQGSATTAAPVFYPTHGAAVLTTFGFAFTLGACAVKAGLTATGTVHGWCGLSTGSGTTGQDPNHAFMWTAVGGTLVIAGQVTGVVNAAPNALAGESCTTGADVFLVNGAVTLLHPH